MQKKKKFRIPRKETAEKSLAEMQKQLDELHAQIRIELAGRTLPDLAEVIRQGREERGQQLLESIQVWHK